MKQRIKKNIYDAHIYGWVVVFVSIIFWGIVVLINTDKVANICPLTVLIVMFFLLYIQLVPYSVTDNKQLTGNGITSIPLVKRIECKEKGGLTLFYTAMENGRERSRCYYPKDEQLFIDTLLQINPNIKLN